MTREKTKRRLGSEAEAPYFWGLCRPLLWHSIEGAEDARSGSLNVFETIQQQLGIAAVETNVIAAGGIGFEAYGAANDIGYRLGFRLTGPFVGLCPAPAKVQIGVGQLVNQSCKRLRRRLIRKQCDFASLGHSFGRRYSIRERQRNAILLYEMLQFFQVNRGIATDAANLRKVWAAGLSFVPNVGGAEPRDAAVAFGLVGLVFTVADFPEQRSENHDPFLALFHLASERLPGLVSRYTASGGALFEDQQHIQQRIGAELAHGPQIQLQGFAVSLV